MISFLKSDTCKFYILTGIPRSGTSLLCNLMNSQPNIICINEVLYNVKRLPKNLKTIREKALKNEPIPNKFKENRHITDTLVEKNQIAYKIADKYIDKNVVIGSKVNIPYLNRIEKILNYKFPIFALIRDPVFTIASWNSHKAQNIPEALVDDATLHQRWKFFQFTSNDPLIRQAEIWEHYASLLYKYKHQMVIIKYEDLTKNEEKTIQILNNIAETLNSSVNNESYYLNNKNVSTRFRNIDKIHDIVNKYCPSKYKFGYTHEF